MRKVYPLVKCDSTGRNFEHGTKLDKFYQNRLVENVGKKLFSTHFF